MMFSYAAKKKKKRFLELKVAGESFMVRAFCFRKFNNLPHLNHNNKFEKKLCYTFFFFFRVDIPAFFVLKFL